MPTTRSCGSSRAGDMVVTSDAELAARVRALGARRRGRGNVPATARITAVSEEGLRASVEKMRSEGVADAAIRAFEHYYRQLEAGETGLMPEDSIEPVTDLPELDELPSTTRRRARGAAEGDRAAPQRRARHQHGPDRARSRCWRPRTGYSFLDIIARQVLALRAEHDARLPLVLMDSFSTREDSLEALRALPGPRRRPAAGLPPEQGAEAARRRPDARSSGPTTRRWSGARPATATSTRRS